jgi:hypothetical protein
MATPPSPLEVLDREFLEVRAKLLEIGAALDRYDRAAQAAGLELPDYVDPRLVGIQKSLTVLVDRGPGRAEKIQQIFSDPYLPQWREQFELSR